jgi:hypothetical protein
VEVNTNSSSEEVTQVTVSGSEHNGFVTLTTWHPLSAKKKLVLTSPTSGGRSLGVVRSRIQTTEFEVTFCGYQATKPLSQRRAELTRLSAM